MKFSIRTLLLIITLSALFIVVFLAIYQVFLKETGVSGNGVSAEYANQTLWPNLHLPDTASDVIFSVDFGAAEAEFAIPESDFLEWCNSNGWETEVITYEVQYFKPMLLPSDNRRVKEGYIFWPPDGKGTFDATRSRACFWVSTFP